MQAFLLIGSAQQQEDFIERFITDKGIPSYHVVRFSESFKIADARTLKKNLSGKTHEEESRLVVIENPTLDSQNALLKTIEELPERTYVIFKTQSVQALVATIVSRVQIIVLEKTKILPDDRITDIFLKTDPDIKSVLEAFNFLSPSPTPEELEIYIVSLRKVLLAAVAEGKPYSVLLAYLKTFMKNYALSESNNINKRMIGEASL